MDPFRAYVSDICKGVTVTVTVLVATTISTIYSVVPTCTVTQELRKVHERCHWQLALLNILHALWKKTQRLMGKSVIISNI